jgi:hypothetical protein
VFLALAAGAASAEEAVVPELSPLASAYRLAMFLIDLQPTDWQHVAATFEQQGDTDDASAIEVLREIDGERGTAHAPALVSALQDEDPNGVFAAATRGVAGAVRLGLDTVQEQLTEGDPGEAEAALGDVRGTYNAFADFISDADPTSADELEQAWDQVVATVRQDRADPQVFVEARSASRVSSGTARP